MKAYSLKVSEFDYPDDMERILDYLLSHGELHITPKEVERAYREYSDDVWCADVEEVRHGEWLENGANYKCSRCGNTEPYYIDSYCCVCGARMDGGKEE